jgi:hypothetical protein
VIEYQLFTRRSKTGLSVRAGICDSQLKVISSGAINPPRAPISILMLQTVIRDSMLRLRMALPAYSTKKPVAPPVVSEAII